MDIKFGIYIPIIPSNYKKVKKIGPHNPIIVSDIKIIDRLQSLRKKLNIIVHVIQWLYRLYKLNNNIATPYLFADEYIKTEVEYFNTINSKKLSKYKYFFENEKLKVYNFNESDYEDFKNYEDQYAKNYQDMINILMKKLYNSLDEELSNEEFFDNHIEKIDSSKKIEDIPRKFPPAKNISDIIKNYQDLLIMYNDSFKEKIIQMLNDYDKIIPNILEHLSENEYKVIMYIKDIYFLEFLQNRNITPILFEKKYIEQKAVDSFPKIKKVIKLDKINKLYVNSFFKDKIMDFLTEYDIILNSYIENFYSNENDFNSYTNSKIFINEEDFNNWINSINSDFKIYYKIDVSMKNNLNPFLFKDDDDSIYIIQNVINGNIDKALQTAYIWFKYNKNIGPDPPGDQNHHVHMIYGISAKSTLEAIEDNTNKNRSYLKILSYQTYEEKIAKKESKYAALLQIF